MYTRTTTVLNASGLHARPASQFVAEAKKYTSDITIKNLNKDKGPISAKSIILLLTLAITKGSEVEITANGEDEVIAVDNLIKLIESGFDE